MANRLSSMKLKAGIRSDDEEKGMPRRMQKQLLPPLSWIGRLRSAKGTVC